ncbi:glycosyltransferase family 2 protein [Zymoseptoria brevis]|uniref:Glycosyltransferase family 2 protein n=1 Tax=Zymoseptoria brevis TaxID=1047168 RepID=A0A0F4GZV1_9PEZI|nr:glycosyltransferase family 2 protein [Zymoseptoria brevis]
MGLLSYIRPDKAKKEEPAPVVDEKPQAVTPASHSASPSTSGHSSGSWSRPSSIAPGDGFRGSQDMNDLKCDVMVNWLYQQQMERLWTSGGIDEGVVLKKSKAAYTCCPADITEESNGFFKAVETLNVRVAMTVNTRVIKLFLHNNQRPYVPLKNGLRLQVLPNVSYLPRCQKHQFAAFIADRGLLVVWDDEPRHLLDRAHKIEKALMEMIWDDDMGEDEKKGAGVDVNELGSEDGDVAEFGDVEKPRPIMLWQSILCAATLLLSVFCVGLGYRKLAIEVFVDGSYTRLALVAVSPLQFWLGLFFFQSIISNAAQIFGPISQITANTKFYSGKRSKRLRRDAGLLPHVTIQMPVYKEGLTSVIEPTVRSLKAAISTYEMQGGTASIFVNDDGMQVISEEDARARQDYYDEHNIGWVARPKHQPKPEEGVAPFIRPGKFKKASNMNYALWVSNRVEEKLATVQRLEGWTQEDEAEAYRDAITEVVDEDEGRTWADGNIRMGDYILLIDSDTRVPADCFLDAVSEMEQSPQVAIVQFSSGVMNVTDSYFERGITFFTYLIYTAITFAVANGDVAPFVGHNAILRWSALQAIGYDCKIDGYEKFWSEETVSEDFDMALRLQTAGYICRLASYTGDGFQEGVSLTVYDELARWEKYAYGCSELIFNPFRYWLFRGPFTKLFLRFLVSCIPLASKFTIMAYIGTYFALGSAWVLTLANYFLAGWFTGALDHYYIDSFEIYFGIIIIFSGVGNLALAIYRYRTGEKPLIRGIIENFSWVPLLCIFLGGVSLHVSQALLSHLFSINMTWGATSKEAENTTFFTELPKVFRRFKGTLAFVIVCATMMGVMATIAPPFWQIREFIAIFPLSTVCAGHLLLPVLLNPGLMKFTF